MYEVKVFTGDGIKEAADLARKHRLFVSGWCLNSDLKKVGHQDKISIAYNNGVPIGVALLVEKHNDLQCFVRKKERRKGVGTILVGSIKKQDCSAGLGLKKGQSKAFWESAGVKLNSTFNNFWIF